ncbi:esterase-5B-like isoform X2 [Musca domestica]|uniref:Carboxylic ester hydrolase n=1 Tax=Musca domestica TaxID=7370 RepID=A0ABM3VQX0_MUSDO|nr:esterase-5B-like isoform X2 [Musca domestica]
MKFKLFVLGSILFVLYSIWCGNRNKDPLVVEIENGRLRGKDNGFYFSYESIPYAEAPTGSLRFEAPQPYKQKWVAEFNASVKPKPCMQWDQFQEGEDKLTGVEDCLTVNVYKPKTGKEKYPVMVYFHGGCFMFGDVNFYEPDYLMRNGNMILVKVVYRLGPLGFMSTEDEAITGNFGLKDQQLALKWIQKNIANFGGDPSKVMLSGFSAGGASTHYHVLNQETKNLAKTAVSYSGVALNPWALSTTARQNALKVAKILKCPNLENTQEVKKCLQAKPAGDIVSSVKYLLNFGYNPFSTFGPVVEHTKAANAFMTKHPRDIIKSGEYSQIPHLVTVTSEDGGYNAAELLQINPKTGKEYIYDLNEKWLDLAPANLFLRSINDQPVEYAKELRSKYMGDLSFSVDNYWKVQKMYTDVLFKDGLLETVRLHSKKSATPIYGYVYDNPADYSAGYALSGRKDIKFGTNHLDDLSLIFHYPVRSPPRPDEVIISKKFLEMLVNFVETEHLSFGDCEFLKNNKDSKQLKLMSITKDDCKPIVV